MVLVALALVTSGGCGGHGVHSGDTGGGGLTDDGMVKVALVVTLVVVALVAGWVSLLGATVALVVWDHCGGCWRRLWLL